MKTLKRVLHAIHILIATWLMPAVASAGTDYHRLVVFGDSLSDPGNAYVLTGASLVPPYTNLIPEAPYARGGHHLTNGATWIEQLAKQAVLIEQHYGRPMDIEWGKDGNDGKLYILQNGLKGEFAGGGVALGFSSKPAVAGCVSVFRSTSGRSGCQG